MSGWVGADSLLPVVGRENYSKILNEEQHEPTISRACSLMLQVLI